MISGLDKRPPPTRRSVSPAGRSGASVVVVLLLSTAAPVAAQQDSLGQRIDSNSVAVRIENPLADPRAPDPQPQVGPGLERTPLANRWRRLDPSGLIVSYSLVNPYRQNPLKGDFAVIGQNTFAVLNLVANPVAAVSSQDNVDPQFNNRFIGALELFNGVTVFRPKNWSIKGSFQGLFNRGNADLDEVELLELFGEAKLFDVSATSYDFTSTRLGIQAFASDFNGLIFNDINLGGQLFGEAGRNRYRWALAGFSQRLKTAGNGIRFDPLEQTVLAGNLVIEDLFALGFNGQLSAHANLDRSLPGNDLNVYYVGFTSNGHLGRIEFNPTVYFAFGEEDFNEAAQQAVSVSAYLAGLELAYRSNWRTYRAAVFVASGDDDPTDDQAKGFDSVLDNVALFGGPVSFVIGGPQFGTRRNSFLPANRVAVQGSATRANFVNPGMQLINAGVDAVFTPKIVFNLNYNFFRFFEPAALGAANVSNVLGHEINGALRFRAFLDENVVFQFGAAGFFPGDGGEQLLGSRDPTFAGVFALVLTY